MISPIFAKRNRGQVVTAACQWFLEHKMLAFKVMLLPLLVSELLLLVNMLLFKSVVIYIVLAIFMFLVVPVIPCFMFYVVENPEEFGYPDNTHGLLKVYKFWWHYFWPIIKINFLAGLLNIVASFTIIIPMILPLLQLLAIVICQREDKSVAALVDAFKMIFKSFGTFAMCFIGSAIIMCCMIGVPCLMISFAEYCMRNYIGIEMYKEIRTMFSSTHFNAYLLVVPLGVALSIQVVTVIVHFFYGHCKETKDHPALIERMEMFS